jgi:4-amino-4-deoxy-L-arabinose transferase-like glycosyltransferase
VDRKNFSNVGAILLIAAILAGASFLLFYHIGAQPLHNDEARYSEVVTESFLHSDHYFDLYYRGSPYFNKPPLLFWFIYVAHEVVPDMQTAVRLPSVIGGVLLVAAVILIVFEATGSLYAAAFGGGILATMASYIYLTRSGRFDSLATLFVALSAYSCVRAFKDSRWFLIFGACVGLTLMMKGPVVIFAIIPALSIAWAYRRMDWLWDPYFWGGVGVALVITLPWHIYETILYGGAFWNEYVLQQIIGRVQENIVSISLPLTNQNYVSYFFTYLAPWSELFCLGLVAAPYMWSRFSKKAQVYFFVSVIQVVSVLAVCFLVQSKAFRYLIPLYPFIAIAGAIVVYELTRLCSPVIRVALMAGCIVLGVAAFGWSAYNGFVLNPSYPYSTDTPVAAQDEKNVAEILVSRHAPMFYVDNTADIGAIMYYSQLIQPYYFPLYGYYPGLYFVLPSSYVPTFENAHPRMEFNILYEGGDLMLAQELGEAGECVVAPYCST